MPRATSASWSRIFGRSGRRGTLSISSRSSCGRPRSWLCWPTSSASPRSTGSECSCFRRSPTPAPTTRAAPSPSWSPPTPAPDGCSRARLRARRPVADPIYVHAKVAIVDDPRLIVGSANLNDTRSSTTPSALVTDDARPAPATRRRLWAEHLECAPDDVAGDPPRSSTTLAATSRGPVRAPSRRSAHDRRLSRLDHVSRRTARLPARSRAWWSTGKARRGRSESGRRRSCRRGDSDGVVPAR